MSKPSKEERLARYGLYTCTICGTQFIPLTDIQPTCSVKCGRISAANKTRRYDPAMTRGDRKRYHKFSRMEEEADPRFLNKRLFDAALKAWFIRRGITT
jgi:hypothetical protein